MPPKEKKEDMVKKDEFTSLGTEVDQLRTLVQNLLAEDVVDDQSTTVPVMDAKYLNGIGKYIVPAPGTLNNHYQLVIDRSNEIDFWPNQSPVFDGLIAQCFLDPAFSKDNHPQYYNFEPLRDNIAVVRNFVIAQVTHGLDTSKEENVSAAVRKLEQMGREIGVALQRDSFFRYPGAEKLDVLEASQPGVGAAKIYELLVEKQNRTMAGHPWDLVRGRDYSDWGLPGIEDSPFSKQNVVDFCLAQQEVAPDAAAVAPQAPVDPAQPPAEPVPFTSGNELAVLGAAIAGSAFSLERVERLPKPVKHRAVEIARDILEKMKVNVAGDTLPQWLDHPHEETVDYANALSQVAEVYADTHRVATLVDPSLAGNPAVLGANVALGKLAVLLKAQAANALELEGKAEDAQMVRAELEYLPEHWKAIAPTDTVDSLLSQVQLGLDVTYGTAKEAELRWKQQRGIQGEEQKQTIVTAHEQAQPQPQAQTQAAAPVAVAPAPVAPQQAAAAVGGEDRHIAVATQASALATQQLQAHQDHTNPGGAQAEVSKLLGGLSAEDMAVMKELGATAHAVESPAELQRQRTQTATRSRQAISARSHDSFTDAVEARSTGPRQDRTH